NKSFVGSRGGFSKEPLAAGGISKTLAIILLSAKNEDRLREQVQRLLAAMGEQQFTDTHLASIAYTLQVGREAMDERLAVLVSSIGELREKLEGFIEDREDIGDLFRGQVKRNKETLAVFKVDKDLQKVMDAWVTGKKYAKLLDLWVKGLVIDWNKLYDDVKPGRISLPAYPFARDRYWLPVTAVVEDGLAAREVCFLKKQWQLSSAA
ncbi:MAG: hypothetical protein GY940_44275, partial [bacterium]|nr:hypothetical protein [bacterium]